MKSGIHLKEKMRALWIVGHTIDALHGKEKSRGIHSMEKRRRIE
jgi:hypothetical protein